MSLKTREDLRRAVINALTPQTPAVRYRAAVAKFKRRTETRPSKPIVVDVKPGTVRHRGVTLYRAQHESSHRAEYVTGGGHPVELRHMPAFRARPYTRPEDRVVVERGALTIGNMRPHEETCEAFTSRMDAVRVDLLDGLADCHDLAQLRDNPRRRNQQRDARRIRMAAKRRRGWR